MCLQFIQEKKLQADNETVKFQLVIREIFLEKKGYPKVYYFIAPKSGSVLWINLFQSVKEKDSVHLKIIENYVLLELYYLKNP